VHIWVHGRAAPLLPRFWRPSALFVEPRPRAGWD
jgi:hypothetical protein